MWVQCSCFWRHYFISRSNFQYNYYHGGKYQFIQWHGINFTGVGAEISPPGVGAFFYNTTSIVNSFKRYIRHHLNVCSKSSVLWSLSNPIALARKSIHGRGIERWANYPWYNLPISSGFSRSLNLQRLGVGKRIIWCTLWRWACATKMDERNSCFSEEYYP